jgi:hypothetical protein
MKKILAALLIATSFLACNSNDAPAPAPTGGGGGGSTGPVTLAMRLQPGDRFGYNSLMDIEITSAGMGIRMKMDVGSVFEVTSAGPQGKELKLTYTRANMSTKFGMLSTPTMDSMMKKAGEAVMGRSVTIVLSPDNKIVEVKGIDSAYIAAADDQTKQVLKSMYSKEQMNSTYGMIFNLYPGKPVKAGDSWDTESDIALSAVQMKVKTKYTLKEVKDSIASIGVAGVIDGQATMSRGDKVTEMPINGTQNGTLNVKIGDGYLKDGNIEMDVKAEIETKGMKLPMVIKMNTALSGNQQ